MKDILKTSRSLLENKSLFKVAYIITTFFFSVHFVQYLSYIAIVLLILWGIWLLIKDIAAKNIKKVYFWQYFTAFLAIGVLSHIINLIIGDGTLFGTAIGFVLLIITAQFMFLFFPKKDESLKNVRLEIYYIGKAIFLCTTICNIIGIIVLFIFKNSLGDRIIIYDNRFTGAYINPNMGAFDCFLCITLGLIIINRSFCSKIDKKPLNLWLYIFGAVLAFFVLIITDSKGSLLALAVFLGIMTWIVLYKAISCNDFKNNVVKLVLVVALLCSLPFMNTVCSPVMSCAVSHSKVEVKLPKNDNKTTEANKNQPDKKDDKITFEHQSGKKDGSGRVGLYKKSFEFFTEKPVLGWGCGNMLLKGNETKNNTIDNVKINFGTKLFEAHNGYLTLLSTSGVVGFLVFATIGFLILFALLKNTVFVVKKKGIGETAFIFAIVVAFCAYAFVEPSLVYYPALVVAVLWLAIGYGFKLFSENKELNEKMPKFFKKMIGFNY